MRKVRLAMWALLAAVAPVAWAQPGAGAFFNPFSSTRNGVHLYGVTLSSGYFSGGTPFGIDAPSSSPAAGSRVVASASANFGWNRAGERSRVSASYTPSYVARPEHTEYNSLNHSLSFAWSRKVGRKWGLNVSASGLVSDLQQTYFSPTLFGAVASLPATFDELAAGMLAGKFTNPQLAAALTGATPRVQPEQMFLYGRRVASVGVQTGLTWAPSERTSFHVSLADARVQRLPSAGGSGSKGGSSILHTTSVNAGAGWGYSVTPRTRIGIDVNTSRTLSHINDGYASGASFSIGRTMSQHWFLQGRGGAGVLNNVRQEVPIRAATRNVQYTAGAGIGYKVRTHTFIGSFDRSLADAYGLGASSTRAASAGWVWKAPGSMWSLSANFGHQQLSGSPIQNTATWRATGGIARALTAHVFMSVQYAYFTLPPRLELATAAMASESGVNVGVTWSPSQQR